MAVIANPKEWPIDNQEVRMNKGALIRVQKASGQYVKMYQADAVKAGLVAQAQPGTPKSKPAEQDKMRRPQGDKGSRGAGERANEVGGGSKTPEKPEEKAPADDFTVIPGVGQATARALAAHGVASFEQLRDAKSLSFLPSKTVDAIAAWLLKESDG